MDGERKGLAEVIDPLTASLRVAAAGLEAQSMRMRVVSENLANAQSTGNTPGADPYQRKTISFSSELDRASDASLIKVDRIGHDKTPFRVEYDPDHPAADKSGFVKLPNVPRATVQYQKVEGGEIVKDSEFVDLDELAKQ